LGFESLKTLEGQFGLLDEMYYRVEGRTPLSLVRTYVGGLVDVRYFLEYPLVNN
jgi:hypothetical protein